MKNKIDTIMDKEDFFSNEVDIVKSGISELSKNELHQQNFINKISKI